MGDAEAEVVPTAPVDFDPEAEDRPKIVARDPVCGMDVDPHTAKHRAAHAGRTYYFCSEGCRTGRPPLSGPG